MRLGFVVKSLAHPDLKSHDSRRWQNNPHLSVSLAYLRDMLGHLVRARISMYRMSSDIAPYATHPDMPQFHDQVSACAAQLEEVGALARAHDVRLSFHPSQHVVLNSPDDGLAARSAADLGVQAGILNAMGLGAEAVVVLHVGGSYGDPAAGRERFVRRYLALPEPTRRRLVLENDDARFGVADIRWIQDRTGVRLVFDNLHHRLRSPDGSSPREALAACLASWPPGVRPKVHFSSPRTEMRVEPGEAGAAPSVTRTRWSYHSDYINPFEFVDFLRNAEGLPPFDVMLEARAKDLAVLQLRQDLARFAPDLAGRLEPGAG